MDAAPLQHLPQEAAPEEVFDDLVRLAAHVCNAPLAALCLTDGHSPCSAVITEPETTKTENAPSLCGDPLCAHTLLQPDLIVVPDARADPRFASSPRVTGAPHIRFYAGMPLILEDGRVLGSLCVIDQAPRPLTAEQAAALRLVARQVTGQVITARRVTERERLVAEKEVLAAEWRRSEARLAEAQRVAQIGSWEYDIAADRITWSDELFRLFEMVPADSAPSVQALMDLYHPDDIAHHRTITEQAIRDGLPYEFDIRIRRRDGSFRWAHAIGQGKGDGTGRIVRLFGTLADITDRKRAEEALRRSEAGLRAVLEAAPIILYVADADGVVTLSEGTGLAALGMKAGEAVGRSVFEFSGGDAEMEALMRRALAGEAVSFDARVQGLCLQTEMRPVRGADGAPAGLIGVCFDITTRDLAEERFRVLFEQSSDAHLLCGKNTFIDCNDATLHLMRCDDKAKMLTLHPATLSPEFQPDGRRSDEKGPAMEVLAYQNGSHRFEWMHRKMDGNDFPVEVSLTRVTLASGPALLAVLHDLTERKRQEEQISDYNTVLEFQKQELEKANAELEALATTDGLTGLKNHRAFQERLAEEVCRTGRYAAPLSLVLLDVDHFKRYNDTYGHPAGDTVLRAVAQVLQACTRDTDLAARYGGEEFVLILPQADLDTAAAIAERVRAAVAAHPWPERAVTVSLGVACLRQNSAGGADLLARADGALYQAKTGGRNQVACWP